LRSATAGLDAFVNERTPFSHDFRARRGTRYNVLLLESDEPYRIAIEACIELVGGRAEAVACREAALSALERQRYDLVVWGVPRAAGAEEVPRAETIAKIRARTEAPIIVIDGGTEYAQLNLEAGADQWLPKPFSPGALVGALRAALRSSASSAVSQILRTEIRGMALDGARRRLSFGGAEVFFTRQEWELFSVLLSHPDRFLSAQEILGLGWSAGEHAAEQLRTYVHRLRQKLGPLALPCRLLSQHGQGYCLLFTTGAARPADSSA
jgi:DNA-binding response OmpR family regulator